MSPSTLALVGLAGLVVGSFLNVVAARTPYGRALAPRSACPACDARIGWADLVPLASYAALGGRARCCRRAISVQYPLVEAATALALLVLAWRAPLLASPLPGGPLGPLLAWGLPAALGLAALAAATVTDLRHGVVPDRLSGGAALVVLAALAAAAPSALPARLAWAAAAAAAALALRWTGTLAFGRPGFGLGDAKLLAVLGLALGPWSLWVLYLGVLAAGATGAVGLATGRLARTDAVPFVPFLAVGAALWLALWPRGPFPWLGLTP